MVEYSNGTDWMDTDPLSILDPELSYAIFDPDDMVFAILDSEVTHAILELWLASAILDVAITSAILLLVFEITSSILDLATGNDSSCTSWLTKVTADSCSKLTEFWATIKLGFPA